MMRARAREENENFVARRVGPSLLAMSVLLLAFSFLLSACGGQSAEEERALARLERLVFVPAAVCKLGREGLDCSNEHPLLVDRYEVTRREWGEFLARRPGGAGSPGRRVWDGWGLEGGSLPATFMDRAEALEFAAGERMRIPTQREWLRISAGTRAQPWPWGTSPARSVANTLDLGLPGALGVGTFEAGATPSGVYDLIGNVREWVAEEESEREAGSLASAMGGSYLAHQEPLFDWDSSRGLEKNELRVDSRHRSIDLGMRLAAGAEEYLRSAASSWGGSPGARARVIAVGGHWGRPAVELLEDLVAEGPVGIAWLLEGARG